MKKIEVDVKNVAFCGLYCGACKKYLNGKCDGCQGNEKASWCKVRSCCLENGYQSCADCKTYADPNDCKMYDNFMARLFGFIFRSDRQACIGYIKKEGYEKFAEFMAQNRQVTMRR
ncbi:MAG: DUF3795 domain-containing protein [Deltaproteobacteria bacterium]|jgi:hypothetical protein|nr:DUF3795 domain-containing protein [Deltaproteobacteria bacterium]MBT4266752.1 DUF3795 domain-containing protein [Deltaproteobacteria bacterium]MBT4641111.1 DUF3795 domain-containing protein [Deltaproteobacteria bacterium]MBT6505007.1 DUF3795 domain-containing protein [Deltaproteobacteria bacterium]MBT6615525.1 DUF3795 domain-containing protein [Deltaproteobacteria bacterium]